MHLSRETNDGLISPKTKVGNWTIVFEYLLQVLSRGWCLPPKCIAQCWGTGHQAPAPAGGLFAVSTQTLGVLGPLQRRTFRHGRKWAYLAQICWLSVLTEEAIRLTCLCSLCITMVTYGILGERMERLYMEAQDGLKTIDPPLFLNIFFYFLLV